MVERCATSHHYYPIGVYTPLALTVTSRPLLEVYFQTSFRYEPKVKSLAVAEIFRYCKGFRLSYSSFCLLDQKYKRGVTRRLFSYEKGCCKADVQMVSLSELFPFIRNGFVGTVTPYFTDEEHGVRYLQGTNIHTGKITNDTVYYVTEDFSAKHSKNILKRDDILVVQSGHVGECAVVGKEYEGANCHALIIMSNGGNCVSDYVAQYINSETGNKQIASITTGNTIQHILASAIAKLTVPIPSFEKQKEVAHLLLLFDNRIAKEERLLSKLETEKKELMRQLFI